MLDGLGQSASLPGACGCAARPAATRGECVERPLGCSVDSRLSVCLVADVYMHGRARRSFRFPVVGRGEGGSAGPELLCLHRGVLTEHAAGCRQWPGAGALGTVEGCWAAEAAGPRGQGGGEQTVARGRSFSQRRVRMETPRAHPKSRQGRPCSPLGIHTSDTCLHLYPKGPSFLRGAEAILHLIVRGNPVNFVRHGGDDLNSAARSVTV